MAPRSSTRSSARSSGLLPWLAISLLVIILDQLTKVVVAGTFTLHEVRSYTSFFDLVLAYNVGAAFNFLADATGWQRWFFVGLGLLAAAFIVVMLKRHSAQRLFCWALALIMGGALGNVIDRLIHGHVIDFIQVHYGSAYFPAFNIADSAITIGAGLLILDELMRVRRAR